jgi:hypothetical protein
METTVIRFGFHKNISVFKIKSDRFYKKLRKLDDFVDFKIRCIP